MKILLVVIGRVQGPLQGAVEEYEERAGRYWKLEVIEVEAGAAGRAPSPERVRAEEAERLRARLPEQVERWALAREGKPLSSEGWARALGDRALHGGRDLALVIGGAFGLAPELLEGAARRISLSATTLPHEMARLVVAEQLYRAGTILRNEPYHKGGR